MQLICTRITRVAHQLQGGVASSAALAYLLAVVMAQSAGPAGRLVQGVLAAPAWAPLSDLSYSAYLYHVQVQTGCGRLARLHGIASLPVTCGMRPSSSTAAGGDTVKLQPSSSLLLPGVHAREPGGGPHLLYHQPARIGPSLA
jgi:hypothetical protein